MAKIKVAAPAKINMTLKVDKVRPDGFHPIDSIMCAIDLFDYIYIETFMMSEEEAREVVSIYSDALKSYQQGSYERYVKEYMGLLYRLKTPLDRGFLFDQTVYKLEDMRKMDNEKSESNH